MRFLKIVLAVLFGFIVGAALYRPAPARAAGKVYVQQAPIGVFTSTAGATVVGFSCAGSGGSTACYVASQ
ncbi:MAG TPA: hypothetical protein VMB49_14600 [Acidobacteriaceae bacterium]|nr:hypothetical protein [Acidobacteriaceae bacterium]